MGQWLIDLSALGDSRNVGIHNAERMEQFGSSMLFNCGLSDVGEEFVTILHRGGILLLRLQLSPSKCPLGTYYKYVESYARLLGFPQARIAASVAGTSSIEGRQPNVDEAAFALVSQATSLLHLARRARKDIPQHDRDQRIKAGIDAARTLAAWKRQPDWYRADSESLDLGVKIGKVGIQPLRTVPPESPGGNLFLGAVTQAISALLRTIPRSPIGTIVSHLLGLALSYTKRLDILANVTSKEAWEYLGKARLPRDSDLLARQLHKLRRDLNAPELVFPTPAGTMPYYLAAPSLIFQAFSVSECLVSLGLPAEELPDAFEKARTREGYSFQDFTVWSDSSSHGLDGWRDGSSSPSNYAPDLIVRNNISGGVLLIDAKFRHSDISGRIASQSSIKDIQAYMQEYELSKSVILAPRGEGDEDFEDLSGSKYHVRCISLPPRSGFRSEVDLSSLLHDMWHLP